MIQLNKKEDCCGCTACIEKCPKQCIIFKEDYEGFFYPEIDHKICINCGVCEKVCPVINQHKEIEPTKVLAIQNKNEEIRRESSSGGIFTLLAEYIIQEKGVVFGARFNEQWEVIHDYTDTIEGLSPFRKSKYVQSRIGKAYQQTLQFLKQGRKVLFSGTPCQIAGLKLFLQKDYINLFTIDFICHGVPSPKIWRMYLEELDPLKIKYIDFRNKQNGWKNYEIEIKHFTNSKTKDILEACDKNIFMRGFLSDLYLRPSCHKCPAKSLTSGSDITLADFWGVWYAFPAMYDNKGTSLITLNSTKATGSVIIDLFLNCNIQETDSEIIKKYNKALYQSALSHNNRNFFFLKLDKSKSVSKLINDCLRISIYQRISNKLHRILTK